MSPFCVVAGKSNGIRSQAETWANALRSKGHQVDLIDVWGVYDWKTYDAIHFFGSGPWASTLRTYLSQKNPKCVFSPIYDPNPFLESKSQRLQKKLSLLSHGKWDCALFEASRDYVGYKRVLVRTEHERHFVETLFGVPDELVVNVPLSFSSNLSYDESLPAKERFVFHMSLFTQPRKNVVRLVKAASKYGFSLKIAGKGSPSREYDEINRVASCCSNIEILGFISEEQKIDLYKRAKVFALPSVSEGVGIVAVDAALYGADIVVTNIGGPKEYYDGMAELVNPYDVDAIGKACLRLLDNKTYQPALRRHVVANYSLSVIADKLIEVYKSL